MSIWNKYQQKIIDNCKEPLDNESDLSYWRNFLFANAISYIIPLILFLLIPSSIFCFREGFYVLMFLNIKTFIIIMLVAFLPSISVNYRKVIFSFFAFLHSIILLMYLGFFGEGLIYMLATSIFFIAIFPNKYAFLPVVVTFIFGILYSFVVAYDLIYLHESLRGRFFEWIVISLSMTVLIAIFAFLLPRLFANMQATIDTQKELQKELNLKNKELLENRENLRVLNAELEKRVDERTQDLEEAFQQLETFSYSISHDLQMPIRAINIFTLALEKESKNELSDKGMDYLERIISSTQKMTDLIQSLLKFSQINKQGVSKKEINTEALFNAIWLNLTNHNSKQIDFTLHKVPNIFGDGILIQQVIENLLSNAIKYSSKQEEQKIEVGCKDGVFYVKDNGVGFNMVSHDRIFNIFKRLHTDDDFEGTGVGLSIVKLIVEKHGGEIWAEAEKDKGATFYFTLPN